MSLWGKGVNVWNSLGAEPGHELRNRIAQGTVVQLHGSYWVDAEQWTNLSRWEQERLRIKAVGKQAATAVVVGRSAGILWRLDVLGINRPVELARREGIRPQGKAYWPKGVHYRTTNFLEGDIVEAKGIAMTSVGRTIIDICRWDGFIPGLVAWESALRADRVPRNIHHKIDSMKRMNGMPTVRKVMKYANLESESPGESYAKGQLIEAGYDISRFVQNIELELDGHLFRPDFLYDNWLGIEFDGKWKYNGTFGDPQQVITEERRRENVIRNAGFDTLRITWTDLVHNTFIDKLEAKLRMRERQIARQMEA